MIIGNVEIVTVLTILLFGIPITISAIRTNLVKSFSLAQLTKTINRALVVHIIIGLAFTLTISFFEGRYYSNGTGNDLTDLCMGTGLAYLIVGTFFYIPGLVILNIVNLIFNRKLSKH